MAISFASRELCEIAFPIPPLKTVVAGSFVIDGYDQDSFLYNEELGWSCVTAKAIEDLEAELDDNEAAAGTNYAGMDACTAGIDAVGSYNGVEDFPEIVPPNSIFKSGSVHYSRAGDVYLDTAGPAGSSAAPFTLLKRLRDVLVHYRALLGAPTAPGPTQALVADVSDPTTWFADLYIVQNLWLKFLRLYCHAEGGAADVGALGGPFSATQSIRGACPRSIRHGTIDYCQVENFPILLTDEQKFYLVAGYPLQAGRVFAFFEMRAWERDAAQELATPFIMGDVEQWLNHRYVHMDRATEWLLRRSTQMKTHQCICYDQVDVSVYPDLPVDTTGYELFSIPGTNSTYFWLYDGTDVKKISLSSMSTTEDFTLATTSDTGSGNERRWEVVPTFDGAALQVGQDSYTARLQTTRGQNEDTTITVEGILSLVLPFAETGVDQYDDIPWIDPFYNITNAGAFQAFTGLGDDQFVVQHFPQPGEIVSPYDDPVQAPEGAAFTPAFSATAQAAPSRTCTKPPAFPVRWQRTDSTFMADANAYASDVDYSYWNWNYTVTRTTNKPADPYYRQYYLLQDPPTLGSIPQYVPFKTPPGTTGESCMLLDVKTAKTQSDAGQLTWGYTPPAGMLRGGMFAYEYSWGIVEVSPFDDTTFDYTGGTKQCLTAYCVYSTIQQGATSLYSAAVASQSQPNSTTDPTFQRSDYDGTIATDQADFAYAVYQAIVNFSVQIWSAPSVENPTADVSFDCELVMVDHDADSITTLFTESHTVTIVGGEVPLNVLAFGDSFNTQLDPIALGALPGGEYSLYVRLNNISWTGVASAPAPSLVTEGESGDWSLYIDVNSDGRMGGVYSSQGSVWPSERYIPQLLENGDISMTWSATGLPSGLSVNATTGNVSGTPASGSAGFYHPLLEGVHSQGTGLVNAPLLVMAAFSPVTTSSAETLLVVGHHAVVRLEARSGGTNFTGLHAFSFAADNMPPGLTLNEQTGVVTGIPTKAGTYSCRITASFMPSTDGLWVSDIREYTVSLVVTASDANYTRTPIVYSAHYIEGLGDLPFEHQVQAINAPTGFSAVGLPSGLSIDATTGLITGTLDPVADGDLFADVTDEATITVTNDFGTYDHDMVFRRLGVFRNPWKVGCGTDKPVRHQLEATGSQPRQFSMGAGMASGVTLSSTGMLSGTPTTAGTYTATVTVVTPEGSRDFDITLYVTDGASDGDMSPYYEQEWRIWGTVFQGTAVGTGSTKDGSNWMPPYLTIPLDDDYILRIVEVDIDGGSIVKGATGLARPTGTALPFDIPVRNVTRSTLSTGYIVTPVLYSTQGTSNPEPALFGGESHHYLFKGDTFAGTPIVDCSQVIRDVPEGGMHVEAGPYTNALFTWIDTYVASPPNDNATAFTEITGLADVERPFQILFADDASPFWIDHPQHGENGAFRPIHYPWYTFGWDF